MLTKKGFTLIEMLLVLSIICTTSILSLTLYTPATQKQNTIDKISNFFLEAKANAILYKEKTDVAIKGVKLTYSSNNHTKTIYTTDAYAKKNYSFSYNANGNIYKAKTIQYVINGMNVNYVFQVGSGCFDVR